MTEAAKKAPRSADSTSSAGSGSTSATAGSVGAAPGAASVPREASGANATTRVVDGVDGYDLSSPIDHPTAGQPTSNIIRTPAQRAVMLENMRRRMTPEQFDREKARVEADEQYAREQAAARDQAATSQSNG